MGNTAYDFCLVFDAPVKSYRACNSHVCIINDCLSYTNDEADKMVAFRLMACSSQKVEWHAGELFPRVGFIVTNLCWKRYNVLKFYKSRI